MNKQEVQRKKFPPELEREAQEYMELEGACTYVASAPEGEQYALVVGGEIPTVFVSGDPRKLKEKLMVYWQHERSLISYKLIQAADGVEPELDRQHFLSKAFGEHAQLMRDAAQCIKQLKGRVEAGRDVTQQYAHLLYKVLDHHGACEVIPADHYTCVSVMAAARKWLDWMSEEVKGMSRRKHFEKWMEGFTLFHIAPSASPVMSDKPHGYARFSGCAKPEPYVMQNGVAIPWKPPMNIADATEDSGFFKKCLLFAQSVPEYIGKSQALYESMDVVVLEEEELSEDMLHALTAGVFRLRVFVLECSPHDVDITCCWNTDTRPCGYGVSGMSVIVNNIVVIMRGLEKRRMAISSESICIFLPTDRTPSKLLIANVLMPVIQRVQEVEARVRASGV